MQKISTKNLSGVSFPYEVLLNEKRNCLATEFEREEKTKIFIETNSKLRNLNKKGSAAACRNNIDLFVKTRRLNQTLRDILSTKFHLNSTTFTVVRWYTYVAKQI